jgi:hypothetical protein
MQPEQRAPAQARAPQVRAPPRRRPASPGKLNSRVSSRFGYSSSAPLRHRHRRRRLLRRARLLDDPERGAEQRLDATGFGEQVLLLGERGARDRAASWWASERINSASRRASPLRRPRPSRRR